MRSRTSLFNTGVAKDLLRRFWPLWTGYFVGMLYLLPVRSYNAYMVRRQATATIADFVYADGNMLVYVSAVVGLLAAMAMFGYLYNTRSCGMMNALPLKRETMFVTAYLTGLLPLIAADIIAELTTMLALHGAGAHDVLCVTTRLAVAVMTNITFYGFAVFCAMLTGNLYVLPLAYAALGLSAWVCEGCLRHILSQFVYGMTVQTHFFDWLSPAVTLVSEVGCKSTEDGAYQFRGMAWVLGYCAAGLAASFLALLLYRRRKMETATDTVAIAVLRPIFKYCMTFGGALVVAYFLYGQLFLNSRGPASAGGTLLLLLIGAFVGYFAAKMIISKTIYVFRGDWKGFIISACLLAVLTVSFELDVFGYEKHLPDAEDVAAAKIDYLTVFEEPENIQSVLTLQKNVIDHKAQNEQAEERSAVRFEYTLKNGRVVKREYMVDYSDAAQRDGGSDIGMTQALLNLPEAIQKRTERRIPVTVDTVEYCSLDWYIDNGKTGYVNDSLRLTPEQTVELYEQCILPDINDGTIGLDWVIWTDEYYDTMTNVYLSINLARRDGKTHLENDWDYAYYMLTVNAKRTLAWIEENTDIEWLPLRVASPLGE